MNAATPFLKAVHETMAREKCRWPEAWHRTRAARSDLYNAMMAAPSRFGATMANSKSPGTRPAR